MTDDSMRALREANPRRNPRFDAFTRAQEGLRDRITGSSPESTPGPARPRLFRRYGLLGAVGAGVAVTALAGFFALTAPMPGTRQATPTAYAAVQKAVADTGAASASGTIITSLRAVWAGGEEIVSPAQGRLKTPVESRRGPKDVPKRMAPGELKLHTTFKWNGDDLALTIGNAKASSRKQQEGLTESRYVDGRYYEGTDGKWVHQWQNDNGKNPNVGDAWVEAARTDISADRIGGIVDVLKDLDRRAGEDGSTIYTGRASAQAIAGEYRDTKGLPFASRPFPKLGDPQTQVKVEIVVGNDGIIREWTCAYSWDGADWVYSAKYKDLGSTPAIHAPDPSAVTEGDGTSG